MDRERLLPHIIASRAETDPDRVVMQHVDGEAWTYRDLHTNNLTWAGAYAAFGVGAGDHVVTMLPTTFDAYPAWLGLAWLGAVEVPINTAYRGRMLHYVINQSRSKAIVIGSEFAERLAEVADELPAGLRVIIADSDEAVDLPFETTYRSQFLGAADIDGLELEGPQVHDIACIIYTSGTTGPSKGVLVPWGQMYYAADAPPHDALTEESAYYSYWPPFHMSGKYALYLPIVRNARMVLRPVFSVGDFWKDVREYNVSYCLLVGPMVKFLMLSPPQPDDADNPLYGVTSGPLFPEIEQFKQRFGVKVTTGFGMTEIGGPIATPAWDTSNWRTVGKPAEGPPGFEVRLVDEHDHEVPVGEIGEMIIRSDTPWALNAGYYDMPDKTAAAWRNGWFHTGDAFKQDPDGSLYFVDRIKDYVRRRGENISTFEVEAYVTEHPGIAEVAAIGVPSEYSEDEVKICVVRAPDAEVGERELFDFLAGRMPRFMVPRYIEFVESLPKTAATQRVRKVELKDDPLNDSTWDREAEGVELPK